MKKKIIGVALVAAMAVTAGWNYNQSQNEMAMSDLALANVDALARGEGGPDWGHHKLVTLSDGKQCCKEDPYLDCNGSYSPC